MELLEKNLHYTTLYDCYHKLLTPKQQAYFEQYYFKDLSFAEIAKIYNVSRTAVYDALVNVYALLDKYEESLQMITKQQRRMALYDKYESVAPEVITALRNEEE